MAPGSACGPISPAGDGARDALDRGAQLAHVAGPVVAAQQLARLLGESRGGGRAALALAGEEGERQRQHVLAAVAQRLELERHHVQAVEQILAEAARAHRLGEVHVGGGDEAHVDLDRARAAHALELALLDHPQQLRLQRRQQVLDLVEVERARGRHLDLAGLRLARVGESTLLVPEQLRLEQLPGDRGAVHPDERPLAPRAAVVQPVRHQVLAGAALALEQHGAPRVGEAQHERHELPHRGRLGHHPREHRRGRGAHPPTSSRSEPPQRRSRS